MKNSKAMFVSFIALICAILFFLSPYQTNADTDTVYSQTIPLEEESDQTIDLQAKQSSRKIIILRIGCRNALVNDQLKAIHNNGTTPYVVGGRTIIPFRFIGEKMGAQVSWKSNQKPITYRLNQTTVRLKIGSRIVSKTRNNKTVKIRTDVPPILRNGITMVPVRVLSNSLNFYVYYDKATKVVVVSNQSMTKKDKRKCFRAGKNMSNANLTPSASDALLSVARQGANSSSKKTVERALSRLEKKADAKSKAHKALLKELLASANGKYNKKRTTSAIKTAANYGINKQAALRAFSAAYERGRKTEDSVTLSFAGDCTFGYLNESRRASGFPAVFQRAGYLSYPFELVRPWFFTDDLTVINFEGTLTTSTKQANKQFRFRGLPAYARILPASSVETATLANNHSYDYFSIGLTDTVKHLKKAGVAPFYQNTPIVQTINGIRVVLVGDNTVVGSAFSINKDTVKNRVVAQIKKYKRKDTVVVVVMHAGIERDTAPNAFQTSAYRSFIDNGADLVVGHHPHVLQGIETYKGKTIAYSLGNFAFGGNSGAKSPDTILLRASFVKKKGKVAVERISVVPCKITSTGTTINNYQPMPVYGSSAKAIVNKLLKYNKKLPYGATSLDYFNLTI